MRNPPKASDGVRSLVALAEENGWAVMATRDGYEFTRDGDECRVRAEEHGGRIYYARLGPFTVLARDRQAQLRAYVNSSRALGTRRVAEYAAQRDRMLREADGALIASVALILAGYDVDPQLVEGLGKAGQHITDGHTPRKA